MFNSLGVNLKIKDKHEENERRKRMCYHFCGDTSVTTVCTQAVIRTCYLQNINLEC